jgi:MFS family permease
MIPASSPLAYRDFRLFLIARLAAVVATMAMIVIIGWQAYDIARSDYGMNERQAAFQLGMLGLAQFVPLALITPLAGWVADRYDRRAVAMLANGIDIFCALSLAWLTATGALNLPWLYVVAILHGTARVFVSPAMSAMVTNLVPSEVIPASLAMGALAWQIGSVAGPALGGLIYAYSPALPYWISAALLTLTVISVWAIKPLPRSTIAGKAHPVRQMIDGLTYVRRERFLLGAITLDLFAVLLAGATALLPVYARDILKVGSEGLGLLRAAPGIGAGLLSIWFIFVPLRNNVGVKMLWSVVLFGAATIVFGLSRNMWLSLSMLAILGAADMLSVYVRSSLIQLNTPNDMRGRVTSVSTLAVSGSNELGEAQSGIAAALLGPVGAVVFGGIGAIFVTALWAWRFPELKNARTFEPQFKDEPR